MENKVKQTLEELELLKEEIKKKPLTEQLFLTRDLNQIEAKITVLKYLLER